VFEMKSLYTANRERRNRRSGESPCPFSLLRKSEDNRGREVGSLPLRRLTVGVPDVRPPGKTLFPPEHAGWPRLLLARNQLRGAQSTFNIPETEIWFTLQLGAEERSGGRRFRSRKRFFLKKASPRARSISRPSFLFPFFPRNVVSTRGRAAVHQVPPARERVRPIDDPLRTNPKVFVRRNGPRGRET